MFDEAFDEAFDFLDEVVEEINKGRTLFVSMMIFLGLVGLMVSS